MLKCGENNTHPCRTPSFISDSSEVWPGIGSYFYLFSQRYLNLLSWPFTVKLPLKVVLGQRGNRKLLAESCWKPEQLPKPRSAIGHYNSPVINYKWPAINARAVHHTNEQSLIPECREIRSCKREAKRGAKREAKWHSSPRQHSQSHRGSRLQH